MANSTPQPDLTPRNISLTKAKRLELARFLTEKTRVYLQAVVKLTIGRMERSTDDAPVCANRAAAQAVDKTEKELERSER